VIINHDFLSAGDQRRSDEVFRRPLVSGLVVGFQNCVSLLFSGKKTLRDNRFVLTTYDQFCENRCVNDNYNLVVSPVTCRRFDAHLMCERLSKIQFKGRYRALVNHLPHQQMILDEIGSAFPDIDFKIVALASL